MKKGGMFLLGAGYLAGLLVALKFNKKSPAVLEKDLLGDDKIHAFGKNLLEIHKNLFESAQETVFSPENKKIIARYKEEFLAELDLFKTEAETEFHKWKEKGFEKKDEIEAQIADIYARRMEILEKAKKQGIALVEDAQNNGLDLVEEGKKVSDRVFDQARKQLDAMYADIKKTISKK